MMTNPLFKVKVTPAQEYLRRTIDTTNGHTDALAYGLQRLTQEEVMDVEEGLRG